MRTDSRVIALLCILCTMRIKGMHYGLVKPVRPSVRKFQFENYWTDKNESWYGYCAKEVTPHRTVECPKISSKKRADGIICAVGPTSGALRYPKS